MTEKPLPIVISSLIDNNKILLIRRIRGDYKGMWSLPGGKIEKDEHVSEAAQREILEESGISSEFISLSAIISEHLIEDNQIQSHFLLHLCELRPKTTAITNEQEGKLKWFDLHSLDAIKEDIIPSDFMMIQKVINNREGRYYNCIITKKDNEHILEKFERVNS